MKKAYYEGRQEKIITEGFGSYKMTIRYMKNCNYAQVTVYDESSARPLLWSRPMEDMQANAALDLFKEIGYFDIVG